MSSVFPDTVLGQIEFCEFHAPIWAVSPPLLGLSSLQLTNLTTATVNARKDYNLAQSARQASKAATTTMRGTTAIMRDQATDLIRVIKGFAELQANPNAVYGLAQIPAPMPPTPAQAPGQPEKLSVNLESSGAVTISWEATDASASSGAFFNVLRQLPGQSVYAQLTVTPGTSSHSRRMSFTDSSIPTSAAGAGVKYIMQGRRGILIGQSSDAITVQFGIDGGGLTVSNATLKMAA